MIDEACQHSLNDSVPNSIHNQRLKLSKETYKQNNSTGQEKMDGIMTIDGMGIEDLIHDVFIGGNCFDVTNISAPGGEGAYGEFYSGSSSINIEEGIILSTGLINLSHGPNTQTGASSSAGTAGSDQDLIDLINNNNVNDVAIIEFDFIPNDDSISFDYVFASEEYCDYVNSQFNDVFGFFLSGPGINGPFENNAINIAVVPQTSDFVAINNVNWGSNNTFYVDNVPVGQIQGSGGCVSGELNNPPASPLDIQFDGYTTVLTAKAAVTPCEPYHIKLAIADIADGLFDSAVFLKGNSFAAGSGADVEIGYPDPRFEVAFEGCANGFFYFERVGNGDINEPLTINFTLLSNSTATADEDYEGFPNSFTIPAGQQGDTLWINVFDDLLVEGQETIIIELDNTCSCFDPIFELIIDEPEILDFELEDYEFCAPRPVYLRPEVTGGVPEYDYVWENGTYDPERLVAPLETTTYYLTVTDQCGQEKVDSSTFTIFVQLEATIEGEVKLCESNPQDTGYLVINFLTGSGPWGIIYNVNGNPVSLFNITDNPYYLPVTEPGEYELISVFMEDCFGQGVGVATVEVIEIDLDLQTEDLDCFNSIEGAIELTATGGSGDFTYEWDNGAGNVEDPSGLLPGIYTVTVTDTLRCFEIASIEIGAPPPIELINADLGMVNCYDANAGFIDIETSGGTGNLSFQWETGETEEDLSGLSIGFYTVTVTDENDCKIVESFEITGDFTEPIIRTEATEQLTCIVLEALVSGEGSDQGAEYELNWTTSNGNITSDPSLIDIMVDEEGDYQLTIINLNTGCTSTETVPVEALTDPPLAAALSNELITCNTSIVSLDGSLSSPSNLIYEWSTVNGSIVADANTANPMVDAPGEYFLLVTDDFTGCTDETSVEVGEDLNKPTADAGPEVTFTCSQTELSLNAGNSEGKNLSYTWTAITGNIVSGDTTSTPVISQPGLYELIITDGSNGCRDTTQVVALENIVFPTIALADPDELSCAVLNILLDASGSSSGNEFEYTWTSADGSPISDPSSPNPEVSEPGVYTLTVENLINNCTESMDVVVPSNYDYPEADAGPSPLITCVDSIVNLFGSNLVSGSTYSYNWTTINGNILTGQNSLSPSVDKPGIYSLEITDLASGCINVADVEVFLDVGIPLAIINNTINLDCEESQIQLDATGSTDSGEFQLQWSTPDGNFLSGTNTLEPVIDEPGTYTLTIINGNNNCRDESSVVITLDTMSPQLDILPVGEINCSFSSQFITADVITSSGDYEILWVTLDGSILSPLDELTIEVNQGGTYELTIIDNVNKCQTSQSVFVPENMEIPFVTLGPDEFINCIIPTAVLTGTTTGQGNLMYQWTSNNGNILTDPNLPSIEVDQTGDYELTIINLDTGCEDSNSVSVEANFDTPDPRLNQPDTLTCSVEVVEILLSNLTSSSNYTIIWFNPDGSQMTPVDPYNFEVSSGGIYEVEVTNNESGCIATNSIDIPDMSNPISLIDVLMTPPPCYEEYGTVEVFAVEGGTGPYMYSIDGGVTFGTDQIFENLQTGSYSIIVQDRFGCEYTDYIDIPDLPEVDIDVVDVVSISFSESYTIQLEISLPLSEIDTIIWTPAEYLSCTDCPNPTALPFVDIVYHVTVIDNNGCQDEAEIRILVDDEPNIYIPNIFTPFNRDYTNDMFFIYAKEEQVQDVLEFMIFDRWGNRVFENFNFQPNVPSEGWDGTYRNKEVNPAVFAYMAKILLIDGRIIVVHGDVTVLD
jgi:gliding motility-associated-like protein